ncbi:MAG TPA: DNA topoisomerase IB [Actinomycetota bacterium]|nr:DNA topoisomerase IB [Actinomycetota bacterium]
MSTRLRRVRASAPGISRRRQGRGFVYTHPNGQRVKDEETLRRLRSLAIPPAWQDVWVCPDEDGHLQAVGTDGAGRRQYLYHPRWRARRDREKFDRMLRLGARLPRVRREIDSALRASTLTRERTLAGAVRLLDLGAFRVGSESYAEANGSYGLATLRRSHVRVEGDEIRFDYVAKGGKRQVQRIRDPQVARLTRSLLRRKDPGKELLAYREGRTWRDVRSEDINAYLKELVREEVSAKDFRTWHATVLMAALLASEEARLSSVTSRKRVVSSVVKEVAEVLGNTPTVCRTSYIDPRVLDLFLDGETIDLPRQGELSDDTVRGEAEAAVLRLLGGPQEPAEAA